MVLMALDHTRDFFSAPSVAGPSHLSCAAFFTRWATHICAPTFFFLAGASAYLQRGQGKTKGQLSSFLFKRGLWLMLLDLTVITGAIFFCFTPPWIAVFFPIGFSMVCLAGLIRLPMPGILGIAALLLAGHDHFDSVKATSFGSAGPLWTLLHQGGPILAHGHLLAFVIYPVGPWVGVMALGYCFGQILTLPAPRRLRWTAWCGASSVALFLALRALHGYGDPNLWTSAHGARSTILSFLDVEKYPPSLQFCTLFLGLALLLLAVFDVLLEGGRAAWLRHTFEVYGRVPLAFFVAHLYLIHGMALLVCIVMGFDPHLLLAPLDPVKVLPGPPPGYGFSLPVVYLAWLAVIGLLYLPMHRYALYKQEHPGFWWLSYL